MVIVMGERRKMVQVAWFFRLATWHGQAKIRSHLFWGNLSGSLNLGPFNLGISLKKGQINYLCLPSVLCVVVIKCLHGENLPRDRRPLVEGHEALAEADKMDAAPRGNGRARVGN